MNEEQQNLQAQNVSDNVEFIGREVQIGGGFGGMKPLAQHGTVKISDGQLALYDTAGQLIDSAPLGDVTLKKLWYTMGATVMVTLRDKKYSLAVGNGLFLGAPNASLGASMAGTAAFCKAFDELKKV